MASNEIKLSIVFADDGSIKGLEEVGKKIAAIGEQASAATTKIAALETKLARTSTALANSQDKMRTNQAAQANPRNSVDYANTLKEADAISNKMASNIGGMYATAAKLVAQMNKLQEAGNQIISKLSESTNEAVNAFAQQIALGFQNIGSTDLANIKSMFATQGGAAAEKFTGVVRQIIEGKLSALEVDLNNVINDQVANQISLRLAGISQKTLFSGVADAIKNAHLEDKLVIDDVLRGYYEDIEVAIKRNNGNINAAYLDFLRQLEVTGKLDIGSMQEVAGIIKDLPNEGAKISEMLIKSTEDAQQFMKLLQAGAAKVGSVSNLTPIGLNETAFAYANSIKQFFPSPSELMPGLIKQVTEQVGAGFASGKGSGLSGELGKAMIAAYEDSIKSFFPSAAELTPVLNSALESQIKLRLAGSSQSNLFAGLKAAVQTDSNLENALNIDPILRGYYEDIEVALGRNKGEIKKAYEDFARQLQTVGKFNTSDMEQVASELSKLPGEGAKIGEMLSNAAKEAKQYMEAIKNGTANSNFVSSGILPSDLKAALNAPGGSSSFSNSSNFIGPPVASSVSSPVFEEGPVKNSAAALREWGLVARQASTAAEGTKGAVSGLISRMSGLNLNSLFHGLLDIPNRISFAWWKLNNMFSLFSQGSSMISGFFEHLTAGLQDSNGLFEMQRRLGLDIDFLQQLQIAAKITDSSMDGLQVSIKNVAVALGTAQKAAPSNQKSAFQQIAKVLTPQDMVKELGPGRDMMTEIAKGALTVDEALGLMQDALEKTGAHALSAKQKLDIFTAIGGRGGFRDLLATMEKMAEPDFHEVINQMGELGVLLGKTKLEAQENANAAEEFRETWAQVSAIPLGAIKQFDIGAAPFLTLSLERVRDLARELNLGGGGLEAIGATFGLKVLQSVDKITDRLRQFVTDIGSIGAEGAIGNLAEDIGRFFGSTIPELAAKAIPAMLEVGRRAAVGFLDGLRESMSGASISAVLIGAVAGIGIGDIFEKMGVGSATKLLGPLAPAFGTAFSAAITTGLIFAIIHAAGTGEVEQLGATIGKQLGDAIGAAVKIIVSIVDLGTGLIPQALKLGLDLGKGIAEGVNQSLTEQFGASVARAIEGALAAAGIVLILRQFFSAAITGALSLTTFSEALAGAASLGIGISEAIVGAILSPAGLFILGAAIVGYFVSETVSWHNAAAISGGDVGKSWSDAFLLAVADAMDKLDQFMNDNSPSGLLSKIGSAIKRASASNGGVGEEYNPADAVGPDTYQSKDGLGNSLRNYVTGSQAATDALVKTKHAADDLAKSTAARPDEGTMPGQMIHQMTELEAKAKASAASIGMVLNPTIDAAGQQKMIDTAIQIRQEKEKQIPIEVALEQAIVNGDKAAEAAARKRLAETKSAGEQMTKGLTSQGIAGTQGGPSVAKQTEDERNALKAANAAAATRLKLQEQVNAAMAVAESLASHPGFDGMAAGLIKSEAAAQGLKKGLTDSGVQSDLLFISLTKAAAATAEEQNKAEQKNQNEAKALDLKEQLVASGMKEADAEVQVAAIRNSDLIVLNQKLEAAKSITDEQQRAKAVADAQNNVDRANVLILEEQANAVRAKRDAEIQAAQEANNTAKKNLAINQDFANGKIGSEQARVEQAGVSASSAEEKKLLEDTEKVNIAIEKMQRGVVDFRDSFLSSAGQMFDALTDKTKSFSDTLEDIGKQWGRKLFDATLDSKVDFDGKVKVNLLGLAADGAKAFGTMFDNVGLPSIGKLFNKVGSTGGSGLFDFLQGPANQSGGQTGASSTDNSTGFLSSGGTGGQAIDWVKNLFGGGSSASNAATDAGTGAASAGGDIATGSGVGNSTDFTTDANGDFFGVSEGADSGTSSATGGADAATSGAGSGASSALGGAVGGFQTANAIGAYVFKPGDTSLGGAKNPLAIGAERGINSNAKILNDVAGTIIGAILSIWLGPQLGGILGGIISSTFVGLTVKAIDRQSLKSRDFSGGFPQVANIIDGAPLVKGIGNLFGLNILSPQDIIFKLLGIPTIGTAERRFGESIVDASKTFGNEGLQGQYGDFTRDNGNPNKQGNSFYDPSLLHQNYATGAATAEGRGLTPEQIDKIDGITSIIFGSLDKNSKTPQDAGRLNADMRNMMAEFLSRRLTPGMDSGQEKVAFDSMRADLLALAKENGMTWQTAIKNLPIIQAQSTSDAKNNMGMTWDDAVQHGNAAFANSLGAISDIFGQDLPKGVNISALALQEFEKDGVKAFGNLQGQQSDFFTKAASDTKTFSNVVNGLLNDGYSINTAELENRVADVTGSVNAIRQALPTLLSSTDKTTAISDFVKSVQDQVQQAAQSGLMDSILTKTNIGGSFEKAFGLIREVNAGNFDLTSATGVAQFGAELTSAISEGKKNLESYAPVLNQIKQIWDDAFKATSVADFFAALQTHIEDTRKSLQEAIGSSINDQIFTVTTPQAAIRNVGTALKASVQQQIQAGISQALVSSVLLTPALASALEKWKLLFAAALKDGISKSELAQLADVGKEITQSIAGVMSAVRPIIEQLFSLIQTGTDTVKMAVSKINESLRDMLTQSGDAFKSALAEKGANVNSVSNAFAASFREQIRDSIISGMISAFAETALISGMLAPMIQALSDAFKTAMADGIITAAEEKDIKGKAAGLAGATNQAIEFLKPVLDMLASIGIDLYKLLPGSEALPKDGSGSSNANNNYAPYAPGEGPQGGPGTKGAPNAGSQDYQNYAGLNHEEKNIYTQLVNDEGKSFGDAYKYVKDFGAAVKAQGLDVNKAFKSVARVAADLGITFSEATVLLKDSAIIYTQDQADAMASLVNSQHMTNEQAVKMIDQITPDITKSGVDFGSAFKTITNMAAASGLTFQQAAYLYISGLRDLTSATKVTFELLGKEKDGALKQQTAVKVFGAPDAFKDENSQKTDTFFNAIEKAGLKSADAMTYLEYIAKSKGISLGEAMDFFINWVNTGAKGSKSASEQQAAALAQAKAVTDAFSNDLAKAGTGTTAERATASQAEKDYIDGRRAQGATEQQIQTELAEQYTKAGGNLALFGTNLAAANEEMKKDATSQFNDKVAGAATSADNLGTALGNLATAIQTVIDSLPKGSGDTTSNSGTTTPAAAKGGKFSRSAVVGEAGKPELVTALDGGGFEVTPLSWGEAHGLMNGQHVDGFKNGGCKGGGCKRTGACATGCKVPGMANGGRVDREHDWTNRDNTALSPSDEAAYEAWATKYHRTGDTYDYDMRGWWLENHGAAPDGGHFTDKYKKPNHNTFSDESIYSGDKYQGGHWGTEGGKTRFFASKTNRRFHTRREEREYFNQVEPDNDLIYKGNVLIHTPGNKVPGMATGGIITTPHTRKVGGGGGGSTSCGMSIGGDPGWYPAAGGKKKCDGFAEECGKCTAWKEWAPGKWAAKVSNPAGCCRAEHDRGANGKRTPAAGKADGKIWSGMTSGVFGETINKLYGIDVASGYKNPADRAADAAKSDSSSGGDSGGGSSDSGGSTQHCFSSGDKTKPGLCTDTHSPCSYGQDCSSSRNSLNRCRLPDTGCPTNPNGTGGVTPYSPGDPDNPSTPGGPCDLTGAVTYPSGIVFLPKCNYFATPSGTIIPNGPDAQRQIKDYTDAHPKGAATGGQFKDNGRAVVGEAGMPELVEAMPGGGFKVTPISWNQASSMLGGGVKGMYKGGFVGPDPTGPPAYHPAPMNLFSDAKASGQAFADAFAKAMKDKVAGGLAAAIEDAFNNSAAKKAMDKSMDKIMDKANSVTDDLLAGKITPEEAEKKMEDLANKADKVIDKVKQKAALLGPLLEKIAQKKALTFDIDFSSALKDAANSGDSKAFVEAINQQVHDAILDAVIGALLAAGPLKAAIDAFNTQLSAELQKDMADGHLDKEEAARLADLAKTFGGQAADILEQLKPFFKALGIELGNGAASGVQQVKDALSSAADAGFKKGPTGANAPTKDAKGNLIPDANDYAGFVRQLKISLYQNIRQALIQAFVQAAMTEGIIGTMMKGILHIIDQYIDASAEKRQKLLKKLHEQTDALAAAVKDLAPIFKAFGEAIDTIANALAVSVEGVDDAGSAATDAASSACDGQCDLDKRKQVLDLGIAQLNQIGRSGHVQAEVYVPDTREKVDHSGEQAAADNGGAAGSTTTRNHQECAWFKTKDEAVNHGYTEDQVQKKANNEFLACHLVPTVALAVGGVTTGPTNALIGEGGAEAVIPLSNKSAMNAIADALLEGFNVGDIKSVTDLLNTSFRSLLVPDMKAALDAEEIKMNSSKTNDLLRELIDTIKNNTRSGNDATDEQLIRALRKASRSTTKSGRSVL